jgi:hypothetical protein
MRLVGANVSGQARVGSPSSFTRLRFGPFCVMTAGVAAGARHLSTHRQAPDRLTICADAADVVNTAVTATAARAHWVGFMQFAPLE